MRPVVHVPDLEVKFDLRLRLASIQSAHSNDEMSASLAPECNEVKERYDSCFLKWYSEKFLRGTAKTDECEPLFSQYKQCLSKALKDRGIDTMLDEAREDNKENDLLHMRKNGS